MKYLMTFLSFLLLLSCRKDKGPEPFRSCLDQYTEPADNEEIWLPKLCIFWPTTVLLDQYQYWDPCFNPNNGNQIAYIRWSTNISSNILELWTFDFCTGETKYLSDGILSRPNWSTKDWIMFSGTDFQKWKIKSNGDSLTKLTNYGRNINSAWNPKGEHFINLQDGTERLSIIMNENGQHLDTLTDLAYTGLYDWDDQNRICMTANGLPPPYDETGVYYFDLNTKSIHLIKLIDRNEPGAYSGIIDLKWYPSQNAVLWVAPHRVGYTSLATGARTNLLYGYDNWRYISFSLSPDEKTMVLQRLDLTDINGCEVDHRESLYLLDIETGEERRILIPE